MSPDKARATLAAELERLNCNWLAKVARETDLEADRFLAASVSAIQASAVAEREAVVAWLREQPSIRKISPDHVKATTPLWLATAIESGHHLASAGGEK